MRVLFAVSNDNITTSVVNKYQQKYKEIITSKNVYYFNAIIKELQKNKSYDAIVIGEDLEPISNNNYEAVDKFLFEKLDGISDEASKPTGEDIPIIFICSDRRTKADQLLIKLFGIGIYNAIIGNDRSIETVCNLINKPRNKKEAKIYYKVDSEEVGLYEKGKEQDVSEQEIQNILSHYRKIGTNEKKCIESFDRIAEQYSDTQLRIIVKFLPNEVKQILERGSNKYQKLVSKGTVLSNGTYTEYNRQNPRKPGNLDLLTKDVGKSNLSKPVIIPSTININKNNQTQGIMQNRPTNQLQNINNQNMKPMVRQNNYTPMASNVQNNAQKLNQNQGVREMQPFNSNDNNQNMQGGVIPEQAPKRGRGRPRKVVQPVNPVNTNTSMDTLPGLEPFENISTNRETSTVPQNINSNFAQTEQAPKRGRGRPRKVMQPVNTVNTNTTTSMNDTLPGLEDTFIPNTSSQNANNFNSFDDVLPGLEENQEQPVNLFDINPVSEDTNTPINNNDSFLPGFENDIENVALGNETNDTNLFDLDLEENTKPETKTVENDFMPLDYSNMQNTNTNPVVNSNDNIGNINQNPYDNQMNNANIYDSNFNMNQDMYNSNSNLNNNQNLYNQNTNTNQDIYNQPYNTNLDPYMQNTNNDANQNLYNSNANMNQNMYNSNNLMNMQNNQNMNMNTNLVAGNGKIVAFVGTSKNGTSFIVNNLAQLLSQNGVKTAVLDLTKNKNSYYMFTDNDANLMKKATESIKNLSNGVVNGLEVNKNLTVFTSLPDNFDETNPTVMLQTLSNNFDVALLDCDFQVEVEYFIKANEIYLIQSMDTFTIQPLTQFLSDLKLKNALDESKLRVVINKYVKLRRLDERMIIGGMSKYNEPSMTLQRDLFNAQTIKYVTIPFEMDTYARYLESIAMCNLSLNGYSQNFLNGLEELKNMVYPLISGGNFKNSTQNYTEEKRGLFGGRKNKNQANQTTQFSNNINDTLNKMRTNNF